MCKQIEANKSNHKVFDKQTASCVRNLPKWNVFIFLYDMFVVRPIFTNITKVFVEQSLGYDMKISAPLVTNLPNIMIVSEGRLILYSIAY